jgi:hypothetical protein
MAAVETHCRVEDFGTLLPFLQNSPDADGYAQATIGALFFIYGDQLFPLLSGPAFRSGTDSYTLAQPPPGMVQPLDDLPVIINSLKIVKTLLHKIPPNLPLLKGGIIPLFGKEGRGEIFWVMSIQL